MKQFQKVRVRNHGSVPYRLNHIKLYTEFGWGIPATAVAVIDKYPGYGTMDARMSLQEAYASLLPIKATRFIDGFVLTWSRVLHFRAPSGTFQRNFLRYPKMPVSTLHGRSPSWVRACL